MKHRNQRNTRIQRTVLATALMGCLAMTATSVYAQSATSILRGKVAGVDAGTTVTATNVSDGSTRRTTTSADGGYTLVGLSPGTYRVNAGAGGEQTVTVSVATTSTLNLSPNTGVAESAPGGDATDLATVTVTAPPLQEVNTSEVGENISLRQIQTVPQASRNFLEFADAVPGMIFERDQNGRTSLKGGAQNASSTNLYIDGVGQKSYVKKGGVSGQFDSAGNPFPQLAIGEYKVITSNYKAEYGQISSAAVTAVTRSGGNDLSGEVFYRYTDQDLREKRPDENASGNDKVESQEKEYGFAVGGPIIEDRLHFFFTVEKKEFALPTSVFPGVVSPALVNQLPGNAASQFGPTSQPFDEELYFAKLDWDVTDNDHVALSAQRRDEDTISNVGNQTAFSHGITTQNFDRRYNLRWEHSADRWFNEVLATTEDSSNNPVPITFGNGFIYTTPDPGNPQNDATLIAIEGADPRAGQIKGQKGWSIEDNFTFTGFDDHTIKVGARYKKVELNAADALNSNPQFSYSIGSSYTPDQPYSVLVPNPVTGVGGLSPSVSTDAKQIGLYLQDDWQVNDHLMFNLGLRWDYEEVPAYLDFVTPPNAVAAFNSQDPNAPAGQTYAQSLLNGGLDINDYISTGNNREAFKDAWQPRLGFSYDINADQQYVIHGGAGRSYDRNVYDFLQLEVTKAALSQSTLYFQDPANGACYRSNSPCLAWNPDYLGPNGLGLLQTLLASNQGAELDLINNDLKTPYSDQFSLGITSQLGEWTTDATVTRIASHDGFSFVLGNRYPNGNFYDNPTICDPNANPNDRSQAWGCGIPGSEYNALILGRNGIETRSNQLLLSAQKPYSKASGWGVSFAYTFTDAEQNRDINENYSFDYPDLSYWPTLTSNSVPRQRFVATASMDGFWGITFGGKLVLSTPEYTYSGVCGPRPIDPNLAECPPRAGNPDNTIGYKSLDLQATKEVELGGVQLYGRLDLLNAFNWENFDGYITQTQNGSLDVRYNNTGNITGVPRTLKFEVGMRF